MYLALLEWFQVDQEIESHTRLLSPKLLMFLFLFPFQNMGHWPWSLFEGTRGTQWLYTVSCMLIVYVKPTPTLLISCLFCGC